MTGIRQCWSDKAFFYTANLILGLEPLQDTNPALMKEMYSSNYINYILHYLIKTWLWFKVLDLILLALKLPKLQQNEATNSV